MSTVSTDIVDVKVPTADFPTFRPDPEVERIFRNAMAYLVFKWQLFAQMIYSDMEMEYTPFVDVAATDSKTIFLNPDGFVASEITDVLEIVFVLAHEVSHRILYDLPMTAAWMLTKLVHIGGGKTLPYDHDLMGKAMDYRINASLVHSKIGRMPKCGLYDATLSEKGMESCVEIYAKLWQKGGGMEGFKQRKKHGGIRYVGNGKKDGGFDLHLSPKKAQVEADRGKREQAIIAAAQIHERTNPGSLPAMLKRVLDDIVNPRVPWEQHLKSTMRRKAGLPRLDWRYTNRRLASRAPDPLYFAKKGHIGAGLIVVGADNSGSITSKIANVFGSEMLGIVKDLNPSQLVIMWCDAAITRVDVVDDPQDLDALFADWKTTGIGGGGGTSFVPVFDKIEEMGLLPDMLVYLTDMAGTFPSHEPHYPVIWGSTSKRIAPFGEVVHVEI